jgi:hypothetical protein
MIAETGREMARGEGERYRGEEEDEGIQARELRRRFTKKIAPILNLLKTETVEEHLETRDHEAIWRELNTDEDHRNRVNDWLDVLITTQVEGEIQEMSKKAQALKIQETPWVSKGIALRRSIDKEQSAQCQIDMADVTEHFRETRSRRLEEVAEAK